MKKWLVYLIIFFSLFYLVDNVKAESVGSLQLDYSTFDLIKPLSSYSSSEYDIETAKQAVINKLNIDSETEDYIIVCSGTALYGYKWTKDTIFSYYPGLTFGAYNSSTTDNKLYLFFYFQSNSTDVLYVNYDMSTSTLSSLSTVKNGNMLANFRMINGGNVLNGIYQNDGSKVIKYFESSFDISYNTYGMSNKYYGPITICDDTLCYQFYEGDILLKANGDLNIGPNEYTYENIIDTTDISKIEINFKVPQNENFSFDLELLTQFSDYYLAKPYLQMQSIYGEDTILQIDDFLGEITKVEATDEIGIELYEYSGSFGLDFDSQNYLKLIFDTSNYVDDLYIKFTSSLDYEINYIYKIDEIEYSKTIMMNNKYGLYLIPKTINSDNFTNIFINGKYNIQVRNNYDDEENYEVLATYENYYKPNFQYKFSVNNYKNLIYFENLNYSTDIDDSYYITFDTRYFNYAIKEFIYDSPTIVNPNTNEEYTINADDTINKNNSIDDYISSADQFLEDMRKYIMIPVDMFTFFFNQLNPYIKMTIVTIFIILVIIGIISIIKK